MRAIFSIVLLAVLVSCGVQHNVKGSVDFNVNIDEIVIRVKFFCDKKIDGEYVYNTRESYRQCVMDTLQTEKDGGENDKKSALEK
jgi:predicted Rdx family selenoprotein